MSIYDNEYEINKTDYMQIDYSYRSTKRTPIRKYRIFPIIVASILLFSISLAMLGLLWGAFCYIFDFEPEELWYIAYIIYFLSLILACMVGASMCRGDSIWPAFTTALFALVSNLLLSDLSNINITGLLIKLVLSIIIAFLCTLFARTWGRHENSDINLRGELRF